MHANADARARQLRPMCLEMDRGDDRNQKCQLFDLKINVSKQFKSVLKELRSENVPNQSPLPRNTHNV